MRSRRTAQDQVAEVARRRLELLSAELAGLRRDGNAPPSPETGAGAAGEPPTPTVQTDTRQSGEAEQPTNDALPGRHSLRPTQAAQVPGAAAAWLHDRLPPTMQGRVQLGSSHLTVVALIIAVAVAATAWWVVRAGPTATAVPLAASTSKGRPAALVSVSAIPSTGPPTGPAATPAASPSTAVVVDVTGKVHHPGIARLPSGSRVVDALRAAGGARRGVSLSTLNLARVLVDGEQIVVGLRAPAGIAASAAAAPGPGSSTATPMVNVNTATELELEALPGVGPVTAAAIVKWRTENGAFTAVDDLLEVSGIGDATLAEIAPFVTL